MINIKVAITKLKDQKYATPIIVILFITAIAIIYKKSGNNNNVSDFIAIPIEVAQANNADVPLYIPALGTVTPENTTTVKAQINGQLIKLNFQDGQKIKKDELLAQLDPRPYKAQLMQYEGQLLKDKALLENSILDLNRYKDLWKQNSISKQTLDTQEALVKQNEGTVQLDQGALENAKVNLSYCNILAPFDGQLGISLVNEGDFLQTSSNNSIVVLNSLDPISVIFTVPEVELSKIVTEFNQSPLNVEIYDQTGSNILKTGKLVAIDNQIDSSTGTIKLKASFNNQDFLLFPNQFVNIKLLVKKITNAITDPTSAVQHGPNGTFVYLVNKERNKVNIQPIEVELTNGNVTAIKSGLYLGNMVAITGVDKLKDNAQISIPGSNL
jgi:multidrug efflux system membrane fusion protein